LQFEVGTHWNFLFNSAVVASLMCPSNLVDTRKEQACAERVTILEVMRCAVCLIKSWPAMLISSNTSPLVWNRCDQFFSMDGDWWRRTRLALLGYTVDVPTIPPLRFVFSLISSTGQFLESLPRTDTLHRYYFRFRDLS
jgi:hypothetical protein